jgi:hypothetical protein
MTEYFNALTNVINGERRILHALKIEVGPAPPGQCYLSFICWPGIPDTDKTCARLVDSKRTWMTAKVGNAVNIRHENGEWHTYRIKEITLYRCFPTDHNDRYVPCAQDWLDGVI